MKLVYRSLFTGLLDNYFCVLWNRRQKPTTAYGEYLLRMRSICVNRVQRLIHLFTQVTHDQDFIRSPGKYSAYSIVTLEYNRSLTSGYIKQHDTNY